MSDDPFAQYELIEPAGGSPKPSRKPADPYAEPAGAAPSPSPTPFAGPLHPTGRVHDGDTFRLNDNRNARLLGVDAFELGQMGRTPTGAAVPIGIRARDTLAPFANPAAIVTPTGAVTYGRPVVSFPGDNDPAQALLRGGWGMTTPQYLQGDKPRLFDYMDAERDARLNRRGAFGMTYQTPASARAGNPDPVARPGNPNTTAMFWDDPTPYGGLPKNVADGYLAMFKDMRSTPEQLLAYADRNGFRVDPKTVRAFYDQRKKAGGANTGQTEVDYTPAPPRVLTDPKDGAFGAAVRGFADPINMLDEMGGVASSLLPGSRENVWSSDRRFGDIYGNNLEQNRSILGYDDANHPWARFGGQLAGGLALPGASVEGVGFNAARAAIRGGATRFAAQQAARNAVLTRLGVAGGIEGGLAGVGQGEDLQSRALGGAIGAPLGVGLGVGAGVLAPKVASMVGRPFSRLVGREAERTADGFSDGAVDTARAAAQNDLGGAPSPVVPSAAPASAAGRSVIDTAALRAADDTGQGVDMGRAGVVLRGAADDALARGDTVTLHIDGRTIPITKPGMVDDQGQAWGAINLLQPKPGDNVRLEITPAVRAAEGAEPATAAMASGFDQPTVRGHAMGDDPFAQYELIEPAPRQRDRIDVNARARPLLDPASDMERRAAADRLNPNDVLALPANTVDGVEEAARIERGRYEAVRAPNERDLLERRSYPSANNPDKAVPRVGPADLVTSLRMSGGIKDQGGNLAAAGINNLPRSMDFAGNEARLGKLIDNVNGTPLDEAAHRAWEAGWFPELSEPPTISEFIDRITDTHSGANRLFHPDDWQQVDDFARARDERLGVEQAREEGAPLARDRSQPGTLDDLDANAAPVKAYEEWGENAPNLAGNIRLDKLDSPQAIKRALVQTERVTGGFDAARRGRIAQAETANLARDLGMTADDLLKRRNGEAFNAEQALAARQILARSATDLVNMAKRLTSHENPGDELDAKFREAWLRHAAIQEQVAGMTAEAGRLLSQFRQIADAKAVGRVLPSLGSLPGGSARLQDVAERIITLESAGVSPGGINRFAMKALSRKRDMAMEYYINALLSGPQTHAVNILSNTLTALAQIPETAASAAVGTVRRAGERVASRALGRDVGNIDQVMFSEVGARGVGLLQGAREGFRDAIRAFRTGDTSDAVAKTEALQFEAIPGRAGRIIRIPTRLLSAEDELFKGMARRMELTGLAIRQARIEGLRGNAAKARAGALLENPSDEMMGQANDFARYLTFQNPLGPVTRNISAAANSSKVLKFLIPFVKTPANLLRFSAERSPGAVLMKSWRNDVLAGGARRDAAVARVLVGTGVGAMFYQAALAGNITGGGPADESAKRLLIANGWQPYSVKVGDEYYSYRRLDPFSTTIGTVADMVDLESHMTDKQREKSLMLVGAAIANNLASKTWLSGLNGLSDALSDPDRNWKAFVARSLGSIAVPSIVAQVARVSDPLLREAADPIERIRSRVPGLSQSLLPRRDVFGRPLTNEDTGPLALFSPIYDGTSKNDLTLQRMVDAGIRVSKPQRSYTLARKRVDWSPEQFDQLQVLTGSYAKPQLDALVRAPGWAAMGERQQDRVDAIMKASREAAKAQVRRGIFGAPLTQ